MQNLTVYCQPTPRYKGDEHIEDDDASVDVDDEASYMFDMQRSQRGIVGNPQEIIT